MYIHVSCLGYNNLISSLPQAMPKIYLSLPPALIWMKLKESWTGLNDPAQRVRLSPGSARRFGLRRGDLEPAPVRRP